MNTFKRFIFGIIFLTSSSFAQPAPTLFDVPWVDRSIFQRDLVPDWQTATDTLDHAPIYHINLRLSDDLFTVSGQQELYYTNTTDTLLKDVVVRLYPNAIGSQMTVANVLVNGEAIDAILEQQGTVLRVPLPRWLFPEEAVVIAVEFTLQVTDTVAHYGRLGRFENILSLAHGYPTLSVYQDGWLTDVPPESSDPLVADTAFFLVQVDAPPDQLLAATGVATDVRLLGERQVATFVAGAVRDFYLASMTDYVQISKAIGETVIHTYVPPEDAEVAEASLEATTNALELFSQYVPYPYREFDMVAMPTRASGIEYPAIINLAHGLYNDKGTLESVIAHEVGHQWAFNLVGSDQINAPWLDESLTQYLTSTYHDRYGGERFAQGYLAYWQGLWQRSANPEQPIGLPVEAYNRSEYSATVYGRGLFFFRELEAQLGIGVMQQALSTYFSRYAWQFVDAEDLQAVITETCECSVTELFDNWVYGASE